MAEPPITLRAIHDSGPLATPINRIVIHATCPNIGYPMASAAGQALGTARYFQNPAAGGSAHYVCDVASETHCVPDNVTAWHAPPNDHSIGIEICAEGGGYPKSYTRDQWLSPQVWPAVQRAAARTRELCNRFGLPKTRIGPADLLAGKRGVCGHVDVAQAWRQSDHSDVGPGFPWAEFMAEVNAGSTPTPATAVQGDDDMKLIQSPGRGIAVIGAGYFKVLTAEELPGAVALYGKPNGDGSSWNDRQFDLARSVALNGTTAGSA